MLDAGTKTKRNIPFFKELTIYNRYKQARNYVLMTGKVWGAGRKYMRRTQPGTCFLSTFPGSSSRNKKIGGRLKKKKKKMTGWKGNGDFTVHSFVLLNFMLRACVTYIKKLTF